MTKPRKKQVLLIDDERIIRTVHRPPLIAAGFHVVEAENGKQAIEKFISNKGFDLVLIDYNMPGMSGAEIAKELRRLEEPKRSSTIICITASSDPEIKKICMESGIDDVFCKPILPPDLEKLVNFVFNRIRDEQKN